MGLFGPSFLLDVSLGASSSCGNEIPTCSAITDFGSTALIGNARVVDGLGNVIPGPSFTSASGYDYITPPGPLGSQIPEPPGNQVPVPQTSALLLAEAV